MIRAQFFICHQNLRDFIVYLVYSGPKENFINGFSNLVKWYMRQGLLNRDLKLNQMSEVSENPC